MPDTANDMETGRFRFELYGEISNFKWFSGRVMKRLLVVLFIIAGLDATYGQVYNTAKTLRPAKFSIGIAPIYFADQGNFGLYLNGGVGISKKMDLSIKWRLHNHTNYFGGDFEFLLLGGFPSLSLALGMHAYNKLGIDGTMNLTFPIGKVASIYGALDADVEFNDGSAQFPVWGVIGFEAILRRHLSLILELDIRINRPAENMFGIGLNVFI